MDLGNQSLVFLVLLLAAPVVVVAAINLIFHPRGGVIRGFGGALFIAMCWLASIASILWRLHH